MKSGLNSSTCHLADLPLKICFEGLPSKKKYDFSLKLLDVITCPFTSPKLLLLFAGITTIHHVIQTS